MRPNRRHRLVLALLTLPLAWALVACGADDGNDAMTTAEPASPDAGAGSSLIDDSAAREASDEEAGAVDTATSTAVIDRAVIATGSLRLTTRHLADARQDAIGLVNGFGGHVADEQSQSDSKGDLDRVDLTLRVPVASFEKALDALGRLGTVRNRQQSVEDVTTQVIDNAARVKAQEASVASIERLLARATTIGEIMSIERQLSTRQAELDSLKQQQKWLADQTSLSTVHLSLSRPAKDADDDESGFLGGLERGWDALGDSALAVATGVGAVLPFAAVLALVGVPAWLLLRRRRHGRVAPAPDPPASEA